MLKCPKFLAKELEAVKRIILYIFIYLFITFTIFETQTNIKSFPIFYYQHIYFDSIQSASAATLAYTPGANGLPQPKPHETMPTCLPPTTNGPPSSPEQAS